MTLTVTRTLSVTNGEVQLVRKGRGRVLVVTDEHGQRVQVDLTDDETFAELRRMLAPEKPLRPGTPGGGDPVTTTETVMIGKAVRLRNSASGTPTWHVTTTDGRAWRTGVDSQVGHQPWDLWAADGRVVGLTITDGRITHATTLDDELDRAQGVRGPSLP